MVEPSVTEGPIPPASRRRVAFVLAVPLAIGAAAYARTLAGPLTFDDRRAISENPAIKNIGRLFSELSFLAPVSGGRTLTDLTFALNYVVGRLEPWNYHLTNIAIHLAVVVLAYAFTAGVARLAGAARRDGFALAVAGMLALHPIQTEAVGYVVQRAELLASGFYLAALLLLLAAERHGPTWRGAIAWAGALASYAAGLSSKTIVITAPLAHILITAVVAGTPAARRELTSWRRRLVIVAPLLALGVGHAIVTLSSLEGHGDAGFAVPGVPPVAYLATQLRVLPVYLRLLAWPAGQNVDWDFPVSRSLTEPGVLASATFLLILGLTAATLAAWARKRFDAAGGAARVAALGIAWFFLVLSVTSSVVPLADVLVEHRLYLASWGIFAVAAVAAERAAARLGTRGGTAAAAAVAALWVALAIATYRRNVVWESSEALWRDAVTKSPGKARIYLSLGQTLREHRRFDEAIAVYAAGLEQARGNGAVEAQLLNNLGTAHAHAGRVPDAVAVFRLALEKAPTEPKILGNLASGLLALGDLDGAEHVARRALTADPGNVNALNIASAWNIIAAVRLERHDPAGALTASQLALEIDPDLGIARFNLGRVLAVLGRPREACSAWRDAIALPLPAASRADAEQFLATRCGAF